MNSIKVDDKWYFNVLLHNLSVSNEIGNDYIKIVPYNSPLTISLKNNSKNFRKFVGSFKNQFGNNIEPSFIFTNNIKEVTPEHLVNFRNILAISTIPKSWSRILSGGVNLEQILYSDYFDIYGLSLSKDEEYLIGHTPSIRMLNKVTEFKGGQSSVKLAIHSESNAFIDESLFKELMKIWTYFHIRNINKNATTVFRSLEIAYRASSLPFDNHASINDYGINISQWISAFEILVHPKTGHAGINEVQKLLGTIKFNSKKLNYNNYSYIYDSKSKRKRFNATAIQKTYYEMYKARNKFLHGEPVKINDLFINNNDNHYTLNIAAPIIYKYALQEVLGINEFIIINDFSDTSIITKLETLRNTESALLKMRHKQNKRS